MKNRFVIHIFVLLCLATHQAESVTGSEISCACCLIGCHTGIFQELPNEDTSAILPLAPEREFKADVGGLICSTLICGLPGLIANSSFMAGKYGGRIAQKKLIKHGVISRQPDSYR